MLLRRAAGRSLLHVYTVECPSIASCSYRAARFHISTRRDDHYQTLEVERGASQQDIKAQFYKLSKKFHPDVNPDSKDANKKFQLVSEAYATLGHADSRKDYDRSMSSPGQGTSRGTGRNFRYASDNAQRRASASYAWEYQRRRGQPRASSSGSSNQTSNARAQYHEFGRGGTATSRPSSMFEKFAERERRKDAAAAARAGDSRPPPGFINKDEHEAQTSSPLLRFCQVAGLFYIVFYIGTALGSSKEGRRRERL